MEKNSKLLSVIVPVYKAEKYLHRCVDSILAQTWSNLEIILVDDGSPDNSGKMCDEYSGTDSRIRVIHKPNGGVSSARNAGIDAATGDYIAFVDSDDYIAPEMYEKLFEPLNSDRSIVMCDFMLDYGDGNMQPRTTIQPGNSITDAIKSLLMSDIGTGSVYMIAPRDLIGTLRFPEYLRNGEDLWFMLRLISKAESIFKVSQPFYFYDQRNTSSLTHTLNTQTDMEDVKGYEENRAFLKDTGFFETVFDEWAWSMLRFKSTFVMGASRFKYYRSIFPEANDSVDSCPLLSVNMKRVMSLLNHHLDFLAAPLVMLYKLKQCVTRS